MTSPRSTISMAEMRIRVARWLKLSGTVIASTLLLGKVIAGEFSVAVSLEKVPSASSSQVNGVNPAPCVEVPDAGLESIRPILCAKNSFHVRLQTVHSLSDTLSGNEVAALYSFLKSPPCGDEKDIAQLHGLKNDVVNVLRHQADPAAGLTDVLIDIYHDRQQDSVMRDYAIQHMVTWYEQDAPDDSDSKVKIRAALHTAARENSSVAGTALLGMHRLSALDSAFNCEEIDQLALSHALSETSDRATRITALQVCAERGVTAAVASIESLPGKQGSLPLRLSAIAALGRLGEARTIQQLQQLKAGQDQSLGVALDSAISRLKQKEQLEQIY